MVTTFKKKTAIISVFALRDMESSTALTLNFCNS